MAGIARILETELRRLARKEGRAEARREIAEQTRALMKQLSDQHKLIKTLRTDLIALQRAQGTLRNRVNHIESDPYGGRPERSQFSPDEVYADRERLGLSAEEYAMLVGVSMYSIYNWEKGRSRPRAPQLKQWIAVRNMTKHDALERLEAMYE